MKKLGIKFLLGILLLSSLGCARQALAAEKYYGNGVYCNKQTCRVNWAQAWGKIIKNSAENMMTFGSSGWHSK